MSEKYIIKYQEEDTKDFRKRDVIGTLPRKGEVIELYEYGRYQVDEIVHKLHVDSSATPTINQGLEASLPIVHLIRLKF